jgi:hypothetical protein
MQPVFRVVQKVTAATLCALLLVMVFNVQGVLAATLSNLTDTLSNSYTNQTGVTHVIDFTTGSTANLKRIGLQFTTTSGSASKPANLDLNSVTLNTITGAGTGWALNTSGYASGYIYLYNTGQTVNSSTDVTITLDNITNSAIDDCQPVANPTLTDVCSIDIITYDDAGTNVIDTGTATYLVKEDPTLTFKVEAVASGTTHNSITTTQASTTTSLPFGTLKAGNSPVYIAHKLTVTTNAPRGYTVDAYLADGFKGTYTGGHLSPFGAINATWITPQTWTTPTGTSANTDTGWIGANTTDTRVNGWVSATQKFGPISTTPHPIATSTGPDRAGTVIYVTYGVEINGLQPADVYSGNIIYDIQTGY